jgi:hypothetical protein
MFGEPLLTALLLLQAGLPPAQPQGLESPTGARGYSLEPGPVAEAELRQRFAPGQLALLENRSSTIDPDWYMPW